MADCVAITALVMEGDQLEYSEEFVVAVSAVEDINLPKVVNLEQNYPNPFNPQIKFEYSLPVSGKIALKIYVVRGRLVSSLVGRKMPVGRQEAIWRAQDDFGRRVATGVYMYVHQTPEETISRKMCVVKLREGEFHEALLALAGWGVH